jgi:plastocyanin
MNSRRRALGALLAVLTLGATACGDNATTTQSGKSSDDKQEAPTKEAYILAADEICAATNGQTDELFGAIFSAGEPQPAMVQESLGKVLDLIDGQVADLRALTPPMGDEATIDGLLDEAEQTAGSLRTKVSTPEGAMEVINVEDDPFAALNEKMTAYGFKDCAGEGEAKTETFGGDELSTDEQAKATKVDVKGIDFSYQGVPASLPAGPTVFSFANGGSVNHEMGVVKIKEGVSAADAIAKAKADFDDDSFIERFLGVAYALPGEDIALSVKLVPGLYGYACSVEDDSGVPHVNHGMIGTFTVAG